jgi:hypothetical protein
MRALEKRPADGYGPSRAGPFDTHANTKAKAKAKAKAKTNMHQFIKQQTCAIAAASWPFVAFVAPDCSATGMVTLDRGGARL